MFLIGDKTIEDLVKLIKIKIMLVIIPLFLTLSAD
jgi:hypothetical protein